MKDSHLDLVVQEAGNECLPCAARHHYLATIVCLQPLHDRLDGAAGADGAAVTGPKHALASREAHPAGGRRTVTHACAIAIAHLRAAAASAFLLRAPASSASRRGGVHDCVGAYATINAYR